VAPAALAVQRTEGPLGVSDAFYSGLRQYVCSREAQAMQHSDMERELEARGQELMRTLYQAWLELQAQGVAEQPVVDAEGTQRTRERTQHRELETIFGTVTVARTGYGAEGEESLHPLDAKLNLPAERYSLELRRRAAEEASKNSFDETVETLARYTGAHIPKRQVEELVQRAAQDFDAFYEARHDAQVAASAEAGSLEADSVEAGSVLVLTCDGKGVVMHAADLRPGTRKAAERKQHKLNTRLSRGEKRHRKRMATVAAVYTVPPYVRTPEQVLEAVARTQAERPDPSRPRPERKRVWASVEQEPDDVLVEAFREALDRDQTGEKQWVAVVDGNETQIGILEQLAEAHGIELTIILDLFHVLEYLWKAAHAFASEGSAALEKWVLERVLEILRGRASYVAAGMRRSATRRHLSKKQRAPVERCANYLLYYKQYLAYHQYLAAGLPIASGVIEGACRHLVKDRLGRTGARWRLSGAEAVLRLRALRTSNDFDEYWRFHEAREFERNHQAHYAGGNVPALQRPPGVPNAARLTRLK
jgi:hypothetical protein